MDIEGDIEINGMVKVLCPELVDSTIEPDIEDYLDDIGVKNYSVIF